MQESRDSQLAKEKAEEELGELSDAVEMATLDKEMAEERVSLPNTITQVDLLLLHRPRAFRQRVKHSKRKLKS